jgi:hypothetical protein
MAQHKLINNKFSIDDATGALQSAGLTGSGSRALEADATGNITATNVLISEAPIDGDAYGRKNGVWSKLTAGLGDMILSSIQSVTGLKVFDRLKLAIKGTSTGTNIIDTANTSANDYTHILKAENGTIAHSADIRQLQVF